MPPKIDQHGFALVTTLMLLLLGFAIVTALLWTVTYGTKMAGMEQRYTTALDASKGGMDMMLNMLQDGLSVPHAPLIGVNETSRDPACLEIKRLHETPKWTLGGVCPGGSSSTDPSEDPDITLALSGYTVSVKIVDTKQTAGFLFYSISARSQAPNANDRAEISVLYRLAQ